MLIPTSQSPKILRADKHPGNMRFRDMIDTHRAEYQSAERQDKLKIAGKISKLALLQSLGRFVCLCLTINLLRSTSPGDPIRREEGEVPPQGRDRVVRGGER